MNWWRRRPHETAASVLFEGFAAEASAVFDAPEGQEGESTGIGAARPGSNVARSGALSRNEPESARRIIPESEPFPEAPGSARGA